MKETLRSDVTTMNIAMLTRLRRSGIVGATEVRAGEDREAESENTTTMTIGNTTGQMLGFLAGHTIGSGCRNRVYQSIKSYCLPATKLDNLHEM
jgi:hypothetical protein